MTNPDAPEDAASTDEVANAINLLLRFDRDDLAHVIEYVKEHRCLECYGDMPCQCWNDE